MANFNNFYGIFSNFSKVQYIHNGIVPLISKFSTAMKLSFKWYIVYVWVIRREIIVPIIIIIMRPQQNGPCPLLSILNYDHCNVSNDDSLALGGCKSQSCLDFYQLKVYYDNSFR